MTRMSPLQELVDGQGLTIWIVDVKGTSSKLTVPLAYYFQRLGARTVRNSFRAEDFKSLKNWEYGKVPYPSDAKFLLLGMTDSDGGAYFKLINCENSTVVSLAVGAEKYLEHRQRKPHRKAMYLGRWLEASLALKPMRTSVLK